MAKLGENKATRAAVVDALREAVFAVRVNVGGPLESADEAETMAAELERRTLLEDLAEHVGRYGMERVVEELADLSARTADMLQESKANCYEVRVPAWKRTEVALRKAVKEMGD